MARNGGDRRSGAGGECVSQLPAAFQRGTDLFCDDGRLVDIIGQFFVGQDEQAFVVGCGGLTYTVDTLEDLALEQPDTDVFLIVGQDTANRLNTWHRYEEVLALSTLVIVNRAENSAQDPEMLSGARVQNVSMPMVDVSSTRVRAAVASGESITGLTTDAVASVIRHHGLYGASA